MEKTLKKACNYGNCAKFWESVKKLCDKIGKFAETKSTEYRRTQRTLLRSVTHGVGSETNEPKI